MTAAPSQRTLDTQKLLDATEAAQFRASRPDMSAWVSANAGAGKTHVLKMRVLRLLLAGVAPERILCLTYTKTAAAEMSARVFKDLAGWAVASDTALDRELNALGGTVATAETRDAARRLFARAIETPGSLKVQTIHAFCERLLQRFPLEAGLPPGFEVIEDHTRRDLLREASRMTLTAAVSGADVSLNAALTTMIAYAADERFDTVMGEAVRAQKWLEAMRHLSDMAKATAANTDILDLHYRGKFSIPQDDTSEALTAEIAGAIDDATLKIAIADLSASTGKQDNALAGIFSEALQSTDERARAAAIVKAVLTQDGSPRKDKGFVSKAVRAGNPALADRLCGARDAVAGYVIRRNSVAVISATRALLTLATDVRQRFMAAKARTGKLDFDDLIARTATLLSTSEQAQWVLYKLDGGIDHVLVDEAQDTSPDQWNIIQSLAGEFFNLDRETVRTVFAVGDEKQSIYSFQGAEPRRFAEAGTTFRDAAKAVGDDVQSVPLFLSFRTVSPVLAAVDAVFADPSRTPGITADGKTVSHSALRDGQAGLVELWPLEDSDPATASGAFEPLDETAEQSAVVKLCNRIAATICNWLDTGRELTAKGRPVRAGDILILVRKRRPFAAPLIGALKREGIPVAGTDRMVLAEQLVVQDLMALGDFLTLPEDDLALANVLKSPLFDFDDGDLLALAPGRRGSLWSALIAAPADRPRYVAAAAILKRWRAEADFSPPFEFFSELLNRPSHHTGLTYRGALLRRLGPDASDPIDEFLESALTYDDVEPPSLQGFIAWLRDSGHEIKRDMEATRDEVRLMTVHGAKGLEAPIVILPHTTDNPASGNQDVLVDLSLDDPEASIETRAWSLPSGKNLETIVRAKQARTGRQAEEANRLLYVAMTRAEDELYIAGVQQKSNISDNSWYAIIDEALRSRMDAVTLADGRVVHRLSQDQSVPVEVKPPRHAAAATPVLPPDWSADRIAAAPRPQVPLVPSRLAPLDTDDIGDPLDFPQDHPRSQDRAAVVAPAVSAAETAPGQPPTASDGGGPLDEPPAPSPRVLGADNRFVRGLVTHALLQYLPAVAPERRDTAARRFVEIRADMLSKRQQSSIVAEALAVVSDPAFAAAFGPDSRAEVAIVAEIPSPVADRPPLTITGQIDRMVEGDDEVLIIDFKTNRPPPKSVGEVPLAYILQLAAYRLAVQQIFQGKTVRAALLWTDGARLMELPCDLLDARVAELWKAGRS